MLGKELAEPALFAEFAAASNEIADDYEARRNARAIRRIMALADRANQMIDEQKPWLMAKDSGKHAATLAVCTLGLNLFRSLIIWLKPVIPAVAGRAEAFLGAGELTWNSAATPLLGHRIASYEPLLTRVEPRAVAAILKEAAEGAPGLTETADNEIDLETFLKVDLRVAEIRAAEYVDGADKLLRLTLDTGDATRNVFSGIRSAYEPAALVGRKVVLVANLKPRKMRFGVSEGMVLAAGDGTGIFLLAPDDGAKPGMQVR
jgi:methionyl-tRNA synthetase